MVEKAPDSERESRRDEYRKHPLVMSSGSRKHQAECLLYVVKRTGSWAARSQRAASGLRRQSALLAYKTAPFVSLHRVKSQFINRETTRLSSIIGKPSLFISSCARLLATTVGLSGSHLSPLHHTALVNQDSSTGIASATRVKRPVCLRAN
jgi:hypothetical protein